MGTLARVVNSVVLTGTLSVAGFFIGGLAGLDQARDNFAGYRENLNYSNEQEVKKEIEIIKNSRNKGFVLGGLVGLGIGTIFGSGYILANQKYDKEM